MENDTAHMREALAKLADEWADQPTDYDEDTEQQIADGRALRDLLAAHPAEPAPVASRERVAHLSARVVREHEPRPMGCACGALMGDGIDYRWHLVNAALSAAGVFRDEAAVKAEALEGLLETHGVFVTSFFSTDQVESRRRILAAAVLAQINGSKP